MSATTFEGVIENGQVRLPAGVVLPERRTVLVVVPDVGPEPAGCPAFGWPTRTMLRSSR